ncbi:MAG: hemolysin III family protein [Bacteroidaceae bacterium]|nr:hemolysin III family protein [Bacteroidaceae bacterium]
MSEFREEHSNWWTHLIGSVFALSSIWIVWPAAKLGWQWTMGVLFFIVGMFLMFLSSMIFHLMKQNTLARRVMRKFDHINIYVMIACSYTPICIAVVGGWLGWTVFGIMWAVAIGGAVYKIVAIDKYPKLSLAIYLTMGWSIVFIAKPVYDSMTLGTLLLIVAEGVLYTIGTYFYSRDYLKHYHAIWHVFVLLGAVSHWGAIVSIVCA